MRRSNHVRYFAYVLGLFATPGLSEPTRAAGVQSLHTLDVFGASRSIRNCWVRRGFRSESLDFLIGGADHDILTQRGWYLYLDHLLQMKLDSQYPLGFYVMICVVMTLGSLLGTMIQLIQPDSHSCQFSEFYPIHTMLTMSQNLMGFLTFIDEGM